MNKTKFNNQSGRSMVEMLGVLAIVAVLSVGGIAGYSKAMAKFKISKTLDQVSTLVTDIRSLYSGSPDYAGISIPNLTTYEVIPNDMRVGTGAAATAKNAFGGDVLIGPWNGTASAVANQGFQVIYTGLDATTCIQLASSDWGGSAASGFVGMNVSNAAQAASHADPANSWAAGNLPINLNTAAGMCSAATPVNSIRWVYR